MPEWLVRLAGEERDLRLLATELRDPWCVDEGDGRFHLRSCLLDTLDEAEEVRCVVDEFIDRANLLGPLYSERYGGIRSAEVLRLNSDGSREVTAFLSGVWFEEQTVAESPDAGSATLSVDMALLQHQPALAEALRYLREEPDWPGYYKAFKAVRDAAGGERGLRQRGWAAKPAVTTSPGPPSPVGTTATSTRHRTR